MTAMLNSAAHYGWFPTNCIGERTTADGERKVEVSQASYRKGKGKK